jgi:hypothetical protein
MTKAPMKTTRVSLALAPEQLRLLEQRAERCKMSVSAWMRVILMQAAIRPAREGHLRIKEPNGELT